MKAAGIGFDRGGMGGIRPDGIRPDGMKAAGIGTDKMETGEAA